ncbi:Uncharacterized protein Rv1367c [Durusdinium trenchii]|uniref:Uncharacterized protein Rv1367c n=2 Tax=Durusdinium trenchii TaxID=1381693 RepID=A0ABP0MLT0_9DINO
MTQKLSLPNLPPCDPETLGFDKETLETHSAANARQIAMGYMPGVAECAVKDNKLVYVDIRGYQDKERRAPMTQKSLFRCHSMTKPITAVAFMILWEEGKLALDDPVHKYIPAFKNMKVSKGGRLVDSKRPMTLRHLVTHTSGLGYGPSRERKTEKLEDGPYLSLVKRIDAGVISNLKSFCDELATFPLQFHPGDRWEYSMGLDVLGRVLEVVSGTPLDKLFRQRIFRKMGMKDTAFCVSPRKAHRQLTAYYVTKVRSKNRKTKLPNNFFSRRADGIHPQMSAWVRGRSLRVLSGGGICGSFAGGLLSSLRDQTIFCDVLLNGGYARTTGCQVLKPATVRLLCRDWLRMKAVSNKQHLRGWGMGRDVGWCPVGHWMPKARLMFMGGITTSWSISFATKQFQVSMTSSSCDADVHNWDDRKDDLCGAVEHAEKVWQRKRRRIVQSG